MSRLALILTCFLLHILAHADDQYVFDQGNVQQSAQSILDQQITINRSFLNINAVITKLNALGIPTTIKNHNQPEAKNILINSNGTIKDFINITAEKFNYAVNINGTNVVFSANTLEPPKVTSLVSAVPKVSVAPQASWILDPKDKTLRNILTKWTKKEGWQLVWNVKADYPITTSWNIPGTFETAINEILKASQSTNIPLMATMHDKNRVLEIFSTTIVR